MSRMSRHTTTITGSMVFVWAILLGYMMIA